MDITIVGIVIAFVLGVAVAAAIFSRPKSSPVEGEQRNALKKETERSNEAVKALAEQAGKAKGLEMELWFKEHEPAERTR